MNLYSFKRQPHKMVKRTQTIRRQELTNCLSAFDNFVRLVLKGLHVSQWTQNPIFQFERLQDVLGVI